MSTSATKLGHVAERLSGTWYNQLGSCLELTVDDGGRISGWFRSSVGGVDGGHEVSGYVAGDPDGPGAAVGFVVAWAPAHSLTTWSGHYHKGEDAIFTTWLLSEAISPHGEWRSTSVGHDEYRRSRVDHGAAPWLASRAQIPRGGQETGATT